MPAYRYNVIHGAGVFGEALTFPRAALCFRTCFRARPDKTDWEIERELELGPGTHRYWRMRDGKWCLYGKYCEPLFAGERETAYWVERTGAKEAE